MRILESRLPGYVEEVMERKLAHYHRKGAMPVPGPTMIIGVSGFVGIRKPCEVWTNTGTSVELMSTRSHR